MKEKSEFYTLKGYQRKNNTQLTEAMEDYLEMIYRHTRQKKEISTKDLSRYLNVLPSSTSKMIQRLKEHEFVSFEKYGVIQLTTKGEEIGTYLLWRHDILTAFLKMLNQKDFHLEQVEKIEHFIDCTTLQNMLKYLKQRGQNTMEYLELYDKDGNDLQKSIARDKKNELEKGNYYRVVLIYIQNDNNQFLIQKVSDKKGKCYATTGGHVKAGSNGLETAIQEVKEELGITLTEEEITLIDIEQYSQGFQNIYYVRKNIDLNQLTLQKEEVETVSWMTKEQIETLIQQGLFRKGNCNSFHNMIKTQTTHK